MAIIIGGLVETPITLGDGTQTVETPTFDWEGQDYVGRIATHIDVNDGWVAPANTEVLDDTILESSPLVKGKLPVNLMFANLSGERVNNYVEETSPSGFVINKLHFTPVKLDFGVITGLTTRFVDMWSPMLRESDTLQSVTPNDLAGVTLDAGIPIPSELISFGLYTLEVTVSPEGERVFSGYFDFTLDYLPNAVLNVEGRRSLVYSFPHNWTEEVVETYQWKTSVLSSDTGDEARMPLRHYPRLTITNNALITSDMFQTFKNYMAAWHGKDYTLPLWHRQEKLQNTVTAGSTVLDLPVEQMNLHVGSSFMIGYDWDDYEVKQVQALLGGDSVQTTSPFNSTWNAGARAVPVTAAAIRVPTQVTGVTSTIAKAAGILFEVDYSQEEKQLPVVTGLLDYYQSEPVFPLRPNRAQDTTSTFSRPMMTKVDYLAGAPLYFDNMEYTPLEQFFEFLIKDLTELYKLKELAFEVQGKHKALWIPSYDQDFTLLEEQLEGQATLRVKTNEFEELTFGELDDRKHLYLEWHDGTVMTTEIETAVLDTFGDTVLGLADPLPQDLSPNDVKYLSHFYRARLSTDAVTINYITNTVARCVLGFITLKA